MRRKKGGIVGKKERVRQIQKKTHFQQKRHGFRICYFFFLLLLFFWWNKKINKTLALDRVKVLLFILSPLLSYPKALHGSSYFPFSLPSQLPSAPLSAPPLSKRKTHQPLPMSNAFPRPGGCGCTAVQGKSPNKTRTKPKQVKIYQIPILTPTSKKKTKQQDITIK